MHRVPTRTALPGTPCYPMFDRYTPLHMIWGTFLGASGMSIPTALALSIGWEFLEHPLKEYVPEWFPCADQETLQNSTGDVLANMLGYFLGRKVMR